VEMSLNVSEKDDTKLRYFDDDGYRPRAACICVRNEAEDEVRFNKLFFFLHNRMFDSKRFY